MTGSKGVQRILIVLLLRVSCFGSLGSASGATPPTVADIVNGIRQSEAVLLDSEGFVVRCQRVKSEVVTPSRYGGGYLNVEFDVAYKKGQWLVRKHFLGNDALPPDTNVYIPPKPLTIAAKDGLIFQWQQSSPEANVSKFHDGGNLFQCLDYFLHVGFDIAKAMTESNHGDYKRIRAIPSLGDYVDHPFLPDYLEKNASRYVVQPSMDSVDGAPCWVVEYPEMDKFWVDPARGYAVLRRIYHWSPAKPRKFEIHNQDLREVTPRLWLPFSQVVDKYASIVAEERSLWGKVTSRMYYEVKEATVGSVLDDVFKVAIPAGLLVADDARGIEYRVPSKDVDPFRGPDANQWKAIREGLEARGRGRGILLTINVIALIILIAIFIWRRRRRSRSPLMPLWVAVCLGGFTWSGVCWAQAEEHLRHDELSKAAKEVTQEAEKAAGEPLVLFPGEQREVFSWKPEWRRRGDCGPCALFVLMALGGHPVTYAQVKDRIPIDPEKGCSLKSICQAANDLGFPLEVRFVNPKLITDIPRPCVIHGKSSIQSATGHFLVLVDYNSAKGTVDLIDPVYERFSSAKVDSVRSTFTGYTIVPARQRWARWDQLPSWTLLLSTALFLAAIVLNLRKGRPAASATS